VGQLLLLVVNSASTNKIGLADSGNCKLSAAWVGDADDTINLIATGTNTWVEVGRSAN